MLCVEHVKIFLLFNIQGWRVEWYQDSTDLLFLLLLER